MYIAFLLAGSRIGGFVRRILPLFRSLCYNLAMPIRILAPEVANQIAAGEVVERPASAVKELIENSLDAGATDIRVEVREGGRRLIRVQDDGCGIAAAEAELAFARHATSKIRSTDDLDHLTTLGFRGEALASISAVAHVTLLTRAADEEIGTLVRVSEGRQISREPHGAPPGTVVTVEHLFAYVPARLKFLKQPATEASHTQQIVTRFALAYPERRLSLISDDKLIFQSTGSGKLYDVLVKVYGLEMARGMLRVGEGEKGREEEPDDEMISDSPVHPFTRSPVVRVTGYVGAPAMHRSHRGYITLFVNRRWFQDTSIAYSIIQAYHTLLPTGRYPVAVVFIELDPAEVDVNVHPTKAEVRFRDSGGVFGAVQRAVRRTLVDQAPVPQASLGHATGRPGGDLAAPQPAQLTWDQLAGWSERRDALLAAGAGATMGRGDQRSGDSGESPAWPAGIPESISPTQPLPGSPPPLLPLLRVVGQLGATYVICEGPDGMYLIDQHAAHERVLYEQFLAERASQKLAVQPLLEPLVLDLSPEQAAVAVESLGTLSELGIAIEPFGGSSYLVRSLPAILSNENPQSALAEIIDGLAHADDVVGGTHEAALITLICKRAAIKGGQVLSQAEMQQLVQRLEACRSPRTCPHGRPTMIHLSAVELARQFGRM
jgi:DNA mismatch repair protein MutL